MEGETNNAWLCREKFEKTSTEPDGIQQDVAKGKYTKDA
jgi:hypothetical protein